MKEIEKELAAVRSAAAMSDLSSLAAKAKVVNGTSLIALKIADGVVVDDLRKIALDLRNRSADSVVVLISVADGKPVLVCAVSDAARDKGIKAGALVKIGSTVLGGGGGGKDDFAQGGGTSASEVTNALTAIEKALSGN
jgi:alanyl-tRNA synthetase